MIYAFSGTTFLAALYADDFETAAKQLQNVIESEEWLQLAESENPRVVLVDFDTMETQFLDITTQVQVWLDVVG